MAAELLIGDGIVRSVSEGRRRSKSGRVSLYDLMVSQGDVFRRSRKEDDEEELKWASIERLPTYDRLRKGILKQVLDNGRVNYEEVDITKLGMQEKKLLLESILKTAEEDNEKFLHRLRDRIDR